jgi:hypothetical protein
MGPGRRRVAGVFLGGIIPIPLLDVLVARQQFVFPWVIPTVGGVQ